MTPGERVYYHGRLALAASLFAGLFALGAVRLWYPLLLLAIGFGLITGWHAGSALFARASQVQS